MSIGHAIPKRYRRAKAQKPVDRVVASKPSPEQDDRSKDQRGTVDEDVLATFTPEGKDLVERVLASTDLIIRVKSGH